MALAWGKLDSDWLSCELIEFYGLSFFFFGLVGLFNFACFSDA